MIFMELLKRVYYFEMKLPGNWDVKLKDFSNAYVYINIPCNDVCGFCDHAAVISMNIIYI